MASSSSVHTPAVSLSERMRQDEEMEVWQGRGADWLPLLLSFHPHQAFAQGPGFCLNRNATQVTSSILYSESLNYASGSVMIYWEGCCSKRK